MDTMLSWVLPVFYGGLGNLAAYLAAHVLLCLLPAFFIAGAMAALIPKETITRFLGRNSRKTVSYPAAAAAGSRNSPVVLVPPSPSVTTNCTVRVAAPAGALVLSKVMFCSNACAAAGVAAALNVTTSGVAPLPPAKVPMVAPP